MLYKIETEAGQIVIEKTVIKKIVQECITGFEGKVLLANQKGHVGGIVSKIGGVDDGNNITVNYGNNGLDIKMYIVIRFGTSISMITEQLIDNIKKMVEVSTGIESCYVTVIVAGMMSKQLVRRHIEVKG